MLANFDDDNYEKCNTNRCVEIFVHVSIFIDMKCRSNILSNHSFYHQKSMYLTILYVQSFVQLTFEAIRNASR